MLINAIIERQKQGKYQDCEQFQQKLQQNLVYLASWADYQPNSQQPLPPPPPLHSTQQMTQATMANSLTPPLVQAQAGASVMNLATSMQQQGAPVTIPPTNFMFPQTMMSLSMQQQNASQPYILQNPQAMQQYIFLQNPQLAQQLGTAQLPLNPALFQQNPQLMAQLIYQQQQQQQNAQQQQQQQHQQQPHQ